MLAQARDAVLVSVGQTDKTDPEEPGTAAQEVSGFEKARISQQPIRVADRETHCCVPQAYSISRILFSRFLACI